MRGLSSSVLLFRNEFNTFNNTGARMIDSFYHMKLKIRIFGVKRSRFPLFYATLKWTSLRNALILSASLCAPMWAESSK